LAIYNYKCNKCNTQFEVTKRMEDASKEENCPICGAIASRVYTPPGLQFIGTGFYVNDYKKRSTE